jgi:hypothetical protein
MPHRLEKDVQVTQKPLQLARVSNLYAVNRIVIIPAVPPLRAVGTSPDLYSATFA